MDELKRLVATLDENMKDNTQAVARLRESQSRLTVSFQSMRRAQLRSKIFAGVLVVVVVAVALVGVRSVQVTRCIHRWASATGERSGILTALSQQRSDALDALVRDVGQRPPNQAHEIADYQSYIAASDRYRSATEAHPVPRVSTFGCNFLF